MKKEDFRPRLSDSVSRLTSYARICTAQYACAGSAALSQKSDALFRVMLRKAASEELPLSERFFLLSSAYDLLHGTTFLADRKKEKQWEDLAETLIGAGILDVKSGENSSFISLCRCLTDYFYFDSSPEDDDWFCFLKSCVTNFGKAFDLSSGWPGLSLEEALGRIEVMNRYSYMFLDHTYDETISRAFRYYSLRAFSEGKQPLSVWGLLYDLALEGNSCPLDEALADICLSKLETYPFSHSKENDAHLYVFSYHVCAMCREKLLVTDGVA